MKKVLIIFAMIIATLSINAQTYWKKTDRLNIDYGYGYTGWKYCTVDVKIDIDNSRIVIYSKENQIFDITSSSTYDYTDYRLIRCNANDTHYVNCILDIYIYNSGNWYMKLYYNNIEYKYRLRI